MTAFRLYGWIKEGPIQTGIKNTEERRVTFFAINSRDMPTDFKRCEIH
jgi:hypothetical protein